jgi:hypothetical protein
VGVATGSAAIDSYNLQWDRNTGGMEWFDLTGLQTYQTGLSFTNSN